jgi:hypothetical protein
VGAFLDDPAVVQNHQPVGPAHGAEPVGDDQGGPAHQKAFQSILHQSLALGIETAGGFIENEYGRILEDRPGDGNPLPLAARKLDPPFANDRVIAGRQALDELGGVCRLGRRFDIALRGVWARICDVLAHRSAEERRLLGNHPDHSPEIGQGQPPNVGPIDQDPPLRHVPEAG